MRLSSATDPNTDTSCPVALSGPDWQLQTPPVELHSPHYLVATNYQQGYPFPIQAGSSFAYPVGSDIDRPLQDPLIAASPYQSRYHPISNSVGNFPGTSGLQMPVTAPTDLYPQETFRYRVVLRAPTAIVTKVGEPPVTYLNKGQGYQLTITDTQPLLRQSDRVRVRYRTHLRISFHRDDQRANPSTHWQLWKARRESSGEGRHQGRDTQENGPTGEPLQAIEYLDKLLGGTLVNDGRSDQDVQLETSSFSGFSILWSCRNGDSITSPSMSASPECTITVRFNFLTTDFCHYKGVKEFPVRLCARTEMISDLLGGACEEGPAEVCYCKVNLFRLYGAERKLSADGARVRKALDKAWGEFHKRQAKPAFYANSSGMGTRGTPGAPAQYSTRRYKNQARILEELQEKLVSLQVMLSSARPATIFSLQGDHQDFIYPHGSGRPAHDEGSRHLEEDRQSTISAICSQDEWSSSSLMIGSLSGSPIESREKSPVYHAVRVARKSVKDKKKPYIQVLDIDPSYEPPAQAQGRSGKKNSLTILVSATELSILVACFYIGFTGIDQKQVDYYNAVYLTEWTAQDLIAQISRKLRLEPRRVRRMLLVRENSVELVDDKVVRGIADGQVMLAEISETWSFDYARENCIEIRLRC
ncbi:CP2 transcription factor-domain-containing protein [Aspergillus heterothallicus]